MRKLIFIDNEIEKIAKDDLGDVMNDLEYIGNLPESYIETIQMIADFRHLSQEEAAAILFSKENCIVSSAVYTWNHFGSLYQLTGFLNIAGERSIKDVLYIDLAGRLPAALSGEIPKYLNIAKTKHMYENILTAVENNFIISVYDNRKCVRVRVNNTNKEIFRFEDVDLNELVKL